MPSFPVLNSRRRQLTFALVPAFLLATSQLWAASSTVVISQVYTAGGNSGATYNADYVELFNLSSSPVSLSGWSLQYFSATASATSSPVVIPIIGSFTLQPGQRYLIQATPGTTGVNLTNNADQTASGLAMALLRVVFMSPIRRRPCRMQMAARQTMSTSSATARRPTALRRPARLRPRCRSPLAAPTPAWMRTTTRLSSR